MIVVIFYCRSISIFRCVISRRCCYCCCFLSSSLCFISRCRHYCRYFLLSLYSTFSLCYLSTMLCCYLYLYTFIFLFVVVVAVLYFDVFMCFGRCCCRYLLSFLPSSLFLLFPTLLILAYLKRVIAHPSFKNVTFKDAEKLLENMEQGECIVRPSSKVLFDQMLS